MSSEVLTQILSGMFNLIAVIITVIVANSKTLYRIEQLEKKQDKHNNVVERVYDLEKKTDVISERQEDFKERIESLEHKVN